MMTKQRAAGLARIVPNKKAATVTVNSRTSSPITVVCPNAWIKPTQGGVRNIGGMYTESEQTTIKIQDRELNPNNEGRQIRANDTIVFDGVTYVVTDAGGNLHTVRTVWDCSVQPVAS